MSPDTEKESAPGCWYCLTNDDRPHHAHEMTCHHEFGDGDSCIWCRVVCE